MFTREDNGVGFEHKNHPGAIGILEFPIEDQAIADHIKQQGCERCPDCKSIHQGLLWYDKGDPDGGWVLVCSCMVRKVVVIG